VIKSEMHLLNAHA